MSTPAASRPVMTPRKERGLAIFAREKELRARQGAFDRERTRIFAETGRRVSGRESQAGEEERAVRAELRALAGERAGLLAEIAAEEAVLRPRLAAFDRERHAAAKPGQGKRKAPSDTKAEREARVAVGIRYRWPE